MQAPHWLILFLTTASLCASTWGLCHWYYGRKLKDAQHKLERLEKARHMASLHMQQARKQIEHLQHQMLALQRARAQALPQFDTEPAHAGGEPTDYARPPLPANGFADTEPM